MKKFLFVRSKVGDIYVKEKMKKLNFNLGGEQSSHIILGKCCHNWGWFVSCIRDFILLRKKERQVSYLIVFKPLPQVLENIIVKDKNVIDKKNVK